MKISREKIRAKPMMVLLLFLFEPFKKISATRGSQFRNSFVTLAEKTFS